MARRAGKAANRQARQRRVQRAAQLRATGPRPASTPSADETVVEATDMSAPEQSVVTRSSRTAAPRSAPGPRFATTATSRLSERAIAEYHYVVRDLRNIGFLVLILMVLLAVAAIVTNLLGIGHS